MKRQLKIRQLICLATLFMGVFCLSNCTDDKVNTSAYDPNQSVEITDFTPKKGSSRTRLYIYGKNFGNDVNQIAVKVGGVPAKVIGCNGSIIYCMVPLRAQEGSVEVSIANGEYIKADSTFNYIAKSMVSTLCGFKTEDGKTECKDGPFETCGLGAPDLMAVDPKNPNHIYFVDNWGYHLRRIDLETQEVSSILSKGEGGWDNIYNVSFTKYGDSLLVANNQDSERAIAVSALSRANGFKRPQPICYSKKNTICTCHPVNGEMYYSSYLTGDLYRYDWQTGETESLYKVKNQNVEFLLYFHPTGNYAYFMLLNGSQILKAEYDWENKRLKNPNIFAGNGGWGFQDGQGVNARVGNCGQGVFVKNEKYVSEGREDVYDFYFIDQWNHCVRYMTPDGFVFTYAGRGSKGVNNNAEGWIDGGLLDEARFNAPKGITYDERNKTFYINDMFNFRLRSIMIDD